MNGLDLPDSGQVRGIAVVAPLSGRLVRALGTKLTIGAALLMGSAGLWQISSTTVASSYSDVVLGMALVGIGAGLVISTTTASVMSSLPREHTGVGGATNGTFLQTGGALGVAVIGSLLANRYEDRVTTTVAPIHLPSPVEQAIRSSLGAALGVARELGGTGGAIISHAARGAFMSGMDLGMITAAAVALAATLVGLGTLPGRGHAPHRADELTSRPTQDPSVLHPGHDDRALASTIDTEHDPRWVQPITNQAV